MALLAAVGVLFGLSPVEEKARGSGHGASSYGTSGAGGPGPYESGKLTERTAAGEGPPRAPAGPRRDLV